MKLPNVLSYFVLLGLCCSTVSSLGQNLQEEVIKALADKQDDPCYTALFQQEVARRMTGKELPWLKFSPIELRFKWKVDETLLRGRGFPDDALRYQISTVAQGCQIITYDQHKRSKIQRLLIQGPHTYENPQGTIAVSGKYSRKLESIKGQYLACKSGGSRCKAFPVNSPTQFRFEDGSFDFFELSYWGGPGLTEKVITAASSCLAPIEHKIVTDPRRGIRSDLPECIEATQGIERRGATAFTLSEWKRAMQAGRWNMSFPAKLGYALPGASYSLNGSLEVEILFEVGELEVSPESNWVINGPDINKKYSRETTNYTLSNTGGANILYEVKSSVPWLDIDKSKGEIGPKGKIDVLFKLNEAGKLLKHGVYTGTISFINQSNGQGNTERKVRLEVEEEQMWRMTLSGFEQDGGEAKIYIYEKVLLGTSLKPYITFKGVRFNHTYKVDFIIKKKNGKWTWKQGTLTQAAVTAANYYDPALFHVYGVTCLNCKALQRQAGNPIRGAIMNKEVLISFPSIWKAEAEIRYKLKTACRNYENPNGECKADKHIYTRTCSAKQFFPNASSDVIPLQHHAVKVFDKRAPGDKEAWMRRRYFLERIK